MLHNSEKQQLDRTGFVVLENFMGDELLSALCERVEQLFQEEGDDAGSEFKQEPGSRRLANLVDKGDVFQRAIAERRLLELIEAVLGPEFKLSSLNVRSVNPYWASDQPLHADMAAIADESGFWVCNSVWMLDDFTTENGPLRVVPGSHHWGRLPQDALVDPLAAHPQERILTGKAGTVVVMNAHLWHGGLANRTDKPRTALHAFYCRWDKPQQQYQKRLLRAEVQKSLTPELRRLLALDDPKNDELSANPAVRSGFLK